MASPQALFRESLRQRGESLKVIQAYLLQNRKWQFFSEPRLTVCYPASGAMTRQKTLPQQQYQRRGKHQHAYPSRQRPARPARLTPQQQRAAQRGEEQHIEQVRA
jgi:hypothetical protein